MMSGNPVAKMGAANKVLDKVNEKQRRMGVMQEQNLFRTLCPKMVESAASILDEMISEGLC